MTHFDLRRVDAAAAALQHDVAAWRRLGLPVRYQAPGAAGAPHARAHYIAFRTVAAQGGWEGLIRADEWLSGAAPALAALAAGAEDAEDGHAEDLFAATPQPLSLALEPALEPAQQAARAAFAYASIEVGEGVAGQDLQNTPLAALTAAQGTVWLRRLPPPPAPAPAPPSWTHTLPLSLQFLLGSSRLSRGCLSRVGPGDVLLVTEHALRMRCNGLALGWYSINEEGIKVDEILDQAHYMDAAAEAAAQQHEPDAAPAASDAGGYAGNPAAADLMARIPVRLEFVLQQNAVTVGELGRLHPGQIIDLAPLAEKDVLILANGMLLGRGELVQLEDRLGVEMIDIYGSENHAD